jgi:hypothetical protein
MELLTVEMPSDTRRRLEVFGFNNGMTGRDVIVFLLEHGLAILEKRRPEHTKPIAVRAA